MANSCKVGPSKGQGVGARSWNLEYWLGLGYLFPHVFLIIFSMVFPICFLVFKIIFNMFSHVFFVEVEGHLLPNSSNLTALLNIKVDTNFYFKKTM
jgi:hypothetical protein